MKSQQLNYCMTRVTFGDTSSPFLSIATVYMPKITKTYIPKQCKKQLRTCISVDDLLSGSVTDDEALQAKQEMSELMKLGGFDLTKWA